MKLTEELQQKVMKLNRDVQAGKETMPIHLRKILIGLRKAHEGVDTAFELDEVSQLKGALHACCKQSLNWNRFTHDYLYSWYI